MVGTWNSMSQEIAQVLSQEAYDHVIFLMQGGGALGAYQVGVCDALIEQDIHPTWLVGTSIGGINAAIIAGNKPEHRIAKLKEFWHEISMPTPGFNFEHASDEYRLWQNRLSSEWSLWFGVPSFFKPRFPPEFLETPLPIVDLSFYDTSELRNTLLKYVDFDLINSKQVRLSLSAVRLSDGALVHFDNTRDIIKPEHIMASAALPPGFPAIEIDGVDYWDGGLYSNTPLEVIVDEKIFGKILCVVINLFPNEAETPKTMLELLKRKKDLEYASRHTTVIHYFCELQKLHHHLNTLYNMIENKEKYPKLAEICAELHPPNVNVARFHYKGLAYDTWGKDFEFSSKTLKERFYLGYNDVKKALADTSWLHLDSKGFAIHNF